MDLKGKAVIVSGGGSGVGRALCLRFGTEKARVICAGRRIEKIKETAELIKADGGTALPLQTDITDPVQVKQMAAKTIDAFGSIDVLFNNAGSFTPGIPAPKTSFDRR